MNTSRNHIPFEPSDFVGITDPKNPTAERAAKCCEACIGIRNPAEAIKAARRILMKLSGMLPSGEGMGGHAPMAAFLMAADPIREALAGLDGVL